MVGLFLNLSALVAESGALRSNQAVGHLISGCSIFLLGFSPMVFILLFWSDQRVGLEPELTPQATAMRTNFPLMIATMFFPPVLFMCAGFLLLFLRKQALILFSM